MDNKDCNKKENTGVVCPLCRNPDVHFLKETGVWVCNHCHYTWYAIDRCGF